MNLNPDHPDDELLEDARMAASTEWEEQFIQSLRQRRQSFGGAFQISERERATLERIAGYHD